MVPSSFAQSVWRTVESLPGALSAVLLAMLPAGAAEVLPLNSDPGPTPGDLFQSAVIDATPSTPAFSGFDRRDAFGSQFSTGEPGRVVLADNLGTAVQAIYFHTPAPVTLAGYKLYLGSDSSGRGASSVELAVTDSGFGPGTVLSTVNLPSPYPSAAGANSIRHLLVSDSFAPVSGQFFVLRLTPATADSGVRVIELDGIAPTGVLAATHVDFSTAGFTAAATAQTPVNGFTYGYYETANVTSGTFGTSIMSPIGNEWHGLEASQTPSHYPYRTHPGASLSFERPSVRRYSVGSGGEFPYTGSVRLVGRFFRQGGGATTRFVTVNGSTLYIRTASTDDDDFDLTVNVVPGSMIDFGVATGANSAYDTTGLVAWIAPEDAPTPTNIVTNAYNTPTLRSECFALATDGVIGATDATSFDTAPGTGFPYQFAGLLYLENSGSGKATRFDAVSIDLTTSADFSDTPRLYVLRHNSDTASSNPALDDRFVRMPIIPVRTASNSAGQPAYTFDLTSLSPAERTGYGFAVVGAGMYQGTSISISELSATAVRVEDTAVITPQPFLVLGPNGHRYGLSVVRGDWEQAEASAVIAEGHLVTINNSAENAFLLTQFGGENFYIGLKQDGVDAATEPGGGWRWRTGELLSTSGAYANWYPGEPNAGEGPEEDYGFRDAGGTWGDVLVGGYPPALRNTFRGIVEVEAATSDKTFYVPSISAKSNIFDAGLATSTQGGVLPPSIDITGLADRVITFPKIVGVLDTGTDSQGPDGRHTAGRSCDLTSVGGISGYLNGNNTPALLGVFLAATQPGSAPARLDFSTSALGEDFVTLAPQLGQVFFIGDGATSGGITQQFTIPAGATRLFFGVPDGNSGPTNDNATLYHGTPLGYGDNSGTMSLRAFVTPDSAPVAEPDIAVEQPAGVALGNGANTVDFGRAQINTPVVRTFTIRNTGTAELSDLEATIDGAPAGVFVVGTFGVTTLAPDADTTLPVTFTAPAAVVHTAALHITSNDPNESPFDVLLSGQGVNLQITFSAASGPLVISGGTGPYLITLVNGSMPQGLAIAASDPDANGKSNNWLVSGTAGDGAYSFTLRVTDSLGTTTDRTFSGSVDTGVPAAVFALTAAPGPTPGDLFQGAIIDSAPSTPPMAGSDFRDAFGGEFSTLVNETGNAVFADGGGSSVQILFFHTAAPVTLSGLKLYLSDDSAGRGAAHVEVAITDETFTTNTVISSVDLPVPYLPARGADGNGRILVTDGFVPKTAQYFVLRVTPTTPGVGVRAIEVDGVAPTGILAASHVDFSTAGFTGMLTAQTPVNGFTYGYYTDDTTSASFTTNNMFRSGSFWIGSQAGPTPAHGFNSMHSALNPSKAVVRRYQVGSGGEAAHTGTVRLVGRFFDLDTGNTDAFIAIDPDGDTGAEPRTLLLPPSPVRGPGGAVSFDLTAAVAPGTIIDFGAQATADGGGSDSTGFHAWIVSDDVAVPTQLVANALNSLNFPTAVGNQDPRGLALTMATNGVIGASDETHFDTIPGTGFPYQFAGLLYGENAGSGKATRFDSVRIDVTTAGDFADTPRLFLLRHNSDPASSNPITDERYLLLPVTAVRSPANTAGQPSYTFDLAELDANQRTGYGFAIVGPGISTGGAIAVSEISAAARRVADTGVIPAEPLWVVFNGKRYGITLGCGTWEQCEAEAVMHGGHLVAINSAEENQWLVDTFGTEVLSIGMKRTGGVLGWVNGESIAYTNWQGGVPGGVTEEFVLLNYFGNIGKWHDVFPQDATNIRGIIELPTLDNSESNFRFAAPASANIFGAGQANATPTVTGANTGGTPPPWAELPAGAGVVTFSSVTGLITVGVPGSIGPDGLAPHSTSIAAVSGFNGHAGIVNGNSGGFLTGVFVDADGTVAALPPALNFSNNALRQDFAFLSPQLNQPFFVGDGLTGNGTGATQQFVVPPGATRLYLGIGDAYNGTPFQHAEGSGGYQDNNGSFAVRLSATISTALSINTLDFPVNGGPVLVSGGTGPYTVALASGSLPAGLTLSAGNPDANGRSNIWLVSGTAANGTHNFTLRVTDALGATSDRAFTVIIENPVTPPSGLLAWWPAQNATGDIIGGNSGSMNNGATYGAGKVGRGFALDGVDDFVQIPHSAAMNLAGDFTIETWIKRTTATAYDPTLVSKRSADNLNTAYTLFMRADGRLSFASCLDGTWTEVDTPNPVDLNAWSHVAATLTGGQVRLYVNGQLVHTAAFSAARPAVTTAATIGATVNSANPESNPVGEFPGFIDELSLYGRALGGTEISAIHLAGAGGKTRDDLSLDFSRTVNATAPGSANLPWVYGVIDPDAVPVPASFSLLTVANGGYWSHGSGASVGRHDGPADFTSGTVTIMPGQMAMHPSSGGYRPVARWIAPAAGTYAISGSFSRNDADNAAHQKDIHIFHNGQSLFSSTIEAVGEEKSHTLPAVIVAANDTVDFIIGPGNDGYSYDSTGVAASVVLIESAGVPDIAVEQPAGVTLVDGANTVEFGPAQLNTPVVRTFTILNTGTAELTGLAATINGDEGGDFVKGEFGATTLATTGPEASTTLSVTFTATATGVRTAVLHITSNDPNESPFDVLLNGEGVNIQLTFSAASGPLAISGGTGPYLVTLVNGSLPQGLSFAASDPDANGKSNNWLVSGTADNGAYSFTLRVTDSLGTIADRPFSGVVENTLTIPLPLAANPGPTPGDLFQGAVIDSPPTTGALPGFSLGDMFGGQNSAVEPGTTVIEDNHGTLIQNVFFHTAAPVTLSSIKLYLGEDAAGGRGASRVELAVTDATFTLNTVISTMALASPYPVAAGEANLRRILVTDTFAPVTAQYFVLHLTPATPSSGVRVLECDGVAPAGILAASHVDFSSAAGITGTPSAQTAINGFTYGYYTVANTTTGTFSIAGMAANPGDMKWHGTDDFDTPIHGPYETHPGANTSTLRPSIRRYTVGSGGEQPYSGSVRIAGLFFRQSSGLTNRFVTVDGVPAYTRNNSAADDAFDFTVDVAPNVSIDFGVAPGADPHFDTTGMIAWIGTSDAAIPTNVVASAYSSPANDRGGCFALATDGVVGATDATSFDTAPGTGSPNEFAGLIYLENAGSGKATRFDSVRLDETTSGFAETPRLYLLVENSDPASSNPAADARYVLLPATPVRSPANTAGQPFYTFDLTSLTPDQRTGYGFAIAGSGNYTGGAIAVSEISVAAVRVSNTPPVGNAIFGWGDGANMAIGDGTTAVRHTPVPAIMTGALAGKTVTSVVAGLAQSFAVTDGGELYGWGWNSSGAVGDGTTINRPEPVAVDRTGIPAGTTFTAVASGHDYALALTADGKVYSWGRNDFGELGLGDTAPRSSPQRVEGLLAEKTVIAMSAGSYHALVLTSDHKVYGWGSNGTNRLLSDTTTTNRSSPVLMITANTLLADKTISSIHCGFHRNVMLTSDGLVFSWGFNGNGELGDGSTTDRAAPVAVVGALGGKVVVEIAGNRSSHHVVRTSDNLLYAWGYNGGGQLGDGSTTNRHAPVAVDMSGVLAGKTIASTHAGSGCSLVRTTDNKLFTWGAGSALGVGVDVASSLVPVAVHMSGALAGMTVIASSLEGFHALVIAHASSPPAITNAEFPLTGGALVLSGGSGPYLVTVIDGSLPSGLILAASGPDANGKSSTWLVSGSAGNGTYEFTLRLTDSAGVTADRTFSGTIENPIPVPPEVVAWWPGENAGGEIIGGNHGLMKNGAAYGTGKVGQSFELDGINDFVQIPHSAAMNLVGDLTIETWIKQTVARAYDSIIIGKRSADDQNTAYTLLLRADGRLAFASCLNGTWTEVDTTTVIALNAWTHVAVTLTSGQMRLYANGQLVHTAAFSAARPAVTAAATIGASLTSANPESNPLGNFPGFIDELSLYRRGLSHAEIAELAGAGAGGKRRHDLSFDYSATVNTTTPGSANLPWVYGTVDPDAVFGTFVPVPASFSPSTITSTFQTGDYWTQNGASIGRNQGPTDIVNGTIRVRPGQISMHPSSAGHRSVARWIAPAAGTYAISGSFSRTDSEGNLRQKDIHIFHNAESLFSHTIAAADEARTSTHTRAVAVGDTIDFIVGAGNDGYYFDSTGLAASVVLLSAAVVPAIVVEQQPEAAALANNGTSETDFGSAQVNLSVVRTFTIRNTGIVDLTTLAVTMNSVDFAAGVFGATSLAPNAATTLSVTFTPSATGVRTATLHITSNDPDDNPFDIALTGTGLSAAGNAIFGWGDGTNMGIGDGTTTHRFTPVPTIMTGALMGKAVTSVVAGLGQSFAISADGKLFGWGWNSSGAVGDGTTTNRPEPVAVDIPGGPLSGKIVKAVAAGHEFALALTTDGKVYSWGRNDFGELGLGDTTSRLSPQLVQGLLAGKTVTSISAGPYHAMVLTSDGKVYGWGANGDNKLLGDGTTTNRSSPVAMITSGMLLDGKTVTAILCALHHNVMRTSDGLVFSWGFNGNGELGDGTTTDRSAPVVVLGALGGKEVVEISGNNSFHLARTKDGLLYGWGSNYLGQVGDGTTTLRLAPVAVDMTGVLAGTEIVSIHAGAGSSMVRTADNKLFCWGGNAAGQLGVGNPLAGSNLPVAVDMTGVLAERTLISASLQAHHALVIAYAPPTPEIVVKTGTGASLADDANTIDLGTALPPASTSQTVTIRNLGNALLSDLAVTRSGTHQNEFAITGPGTVSLEPGATATFTITFTPAAAGARFAIIHIASDDADENPFDIEVMGTGGVPIAEWRQLHFGTAANSGDAADDADFDDDGLLNLIEFGTGTDPNGANATEEPLSPPLGGVLKFRYTRDRQAMAELTFQVQWSDELTDWNISGITETILSDDGVSQEVEATVPAGNAGSRFVQLQVNRP